MEKITPPLKWAGGKRRLVPYIQYSWASHENLRLVEPFCGGLGISLGLLPTEALLNDINPHLINFYKWLKHGLDISIEMKNSEKQYYEYREEFNDLIIKNKEETKKAAELFYYLNKTGFNGLCRFNKQGKFNVPFGRHSTINYSIDLHKYKTIISNWDFIASSFSDIKLKPDDFVYADPPYDVDFRSYSKDGFSWADQEFVIDWLSDHCGPVIISNSATDRVINLYKKSGYKLHYMKERININSTGDRTPADVVIATKNVEFEISIK
jgi:DNA adenine methylase